MKHDNNCFLYSGKFGPYTCTIGTAKKSSKLGGMKQFIAYQVDLEEIYYIAIWILWNIRIIFLLRSLPATVTSRFQEGGKSFSKRYILTRNTRYKHFDWLHLQLVKKFGGVIAIPPLPEKQVLIDTSFPIHWDYIDGFCWNKHLKFNFKSLLGTYFLSFLDNHHNNSLKKSSKKRWQLHRSIALVYIGLVSGCWTIWWGSDWAQVQKLDLFIILKKQGNYKY